MGRAVGAGSGRSGDGVMGRVALCPPKTHREKGTPTRTCSDLGARSCPRSLLFQDQVPLPGLDSSHPCMEHSGPQPVLTSWSSSPSPTHMCVFMILHLAWLWFSASTCLVSAVGLRVG